MNTKMSVSTLVAAATLAFGGLAFAQATPPTSTAGAGCTATANAMKGGNLGGSPSDIACTTAGSAKTAGAAATTTTTTTDTASTTNTTGSTGANMAGSTSMGSTATTAPSAPMRVARAARADRN